MKETELLQPFKGHWSEDEFATLVRRYVGLVYSIAKRRLANASLAEDITQLVFIRLARKPPKVRNSAELVGWLHRTTVYVTIDVWRSETRRRSRELQAVIMEPVPPETAVWEEISLKLDEALNQLTDQDRHALLLRFFSGKSMRELGAVLGISEDAAKMRVSRAVERLRTQMGIGAVVCTGTMLGTLLMEHSAEAAPVQLVARLSSMKLPAAAGLVGVGGLLGAFFKFSNSKLASGTVILALVAIVTLHLIHLQKLNSTATDSQPNSTSRQAASDGPKQFDSISRNLGITPPRAMPKVQMFLSFHVLDSETGEPLAGTIIQAPVFGVGGIEVDQDPNFLTDSNGTVLIPIADVQSNNMGMNVFVVAKRHVPKCVRFSGSIQADYTMRLDPAMTVSGIVQDEMGKPVTGVKIWLQTPGTKLGQNENIDFQTCPVTNHDDGTWSCGYVPFDYTNEISFILQKNGYATTYPIVSVSGNDLNDLVLTIKRGFTVIGRITDTQEQPVFNADIKTLDNEMDADKSAKTDKDGNFVLSGVQGNEYDMEPLTNGTIDLLVNSPIKKSLNVLLAVQSDGFAPQIAKVILSSTTNVANVTLSQPRIFRGHVVDEAGHPISNVIVQTDWNNHGLRAFDWQTRTDVDGQFEWDSAPIVPILYWIEADGYQVQRDVLLTADGSDHEIKLERVATH